MSSKSYSKFIDQYSLPIVVTIGVATALYKTFSFNQPNESSANGNIPIPKPCYPYVGHLLTMGENAGKTVSEWHKQYGPIINLKLGVQNWLFIGDPIIAHNILKRQECSGRPLNAYVLRKSDSKGVGFAQPSDHWKKARAAMQEVFSPKSIDKNIDWFQQEADKMTDLLLQEMDKNNQVDPYSYFQMYVAKIICFVCAGQTTTDNIDDRFIKDIFETNVFVEKALAVESNLKDFIPLIAPFFDSTGPQKEFDRCYVNTISPFYKKMANENTKKDPPSLVQVLKEREYGFTIPDIARILSKLFMDTFAGALNTPAATFSWMFAILCHHPDIQDKVYEEISQFSKENDRLPTIQDRSAVPYCWSVIKESFRYISIGSFGMPHRVTDDFEAYGYRIPKDTVIVSTYDHIHRVIDHYSNKNTFDPERFLHDDKTMSASANGKPEERDHFRYGWGRRICPGIYVSEMETFCGFVSVFSRCKIEPETDALGNAVYPDIKEGVYQGLTNLPKSYKLKFIRR
ncbi:cytochrome P450 [Backusella circina FSU 941]|nr:cytochrome P450 [Backusella circina FSU 941]